jgi:hypothetical protein
MLAIVNILGTLTVGLCAFLLLRAYARVRQRLLLWSGLCFVGLAANNLLLVADKLVLPPSIDLSLARTGVALLALSVLLYGLVMDAE